jgi:hypothetical protein
MSPFLRRFLIGLFFLVVVPNVALLISILTYRFLPKHLAVIAEFIVFFHGMFYHLVPGFIVREPFYKVSMVLAPSGVMGWVISISFYVALSLVFALLIKRRL